MRSCYQPTVHNASLENEITSCIRAIFSWEKLDCSPGATVSECGNTLQARDLDFNVPFLIYFWCVQ